MNKNTLAAWKSALAMLEAHQNKVYDSGNFVSAKVLDAIAALRKAINS